MSATFWSPVCSKRAASAAAQRCISSAWAGLALMRFGAAGRNALLETEVGADADARNVAQLILGLPAQALAEFAT